MRLSENYGADKPYLQQAKRGFSVFYRGRTLLSRFDPVKQAERAVESALPLKKRTLYLLPSPLLGYGIPLIMNNLPTGSALLCVEADAALAEFSREYINALKDSLNGDLCFIQTESPAEAARFVRRTWGQRRFRRVETLHLTGGWQLNSELYEAEAAVLRRLIATEWANAITLTKLGRLYIRNAIRNLGLLISRPDIGKLDFGSRPIFVLGAGPSLDNFLDNMARFPPPDSSVIICADTALRPLKERNIKPNLVIALEAQHWNLRDFNGTGDWRVPVAMDMSALPAVSGVLGGETYVFWTRWTELSVFERLAALGLLPLEIPALGSVGLSALSIALRLGSGTIFTAGIDFSFTLDKYHCRGSPSHSEALSRHNRFGGLYPAILRALNATYASTVSHPQNVRDLAAKDARGVWRSDPVMKNYRDMFKAEFSGCGRVFAIAGGGLPPGVETIEYDAALRMIPDTIKPCLPNTGSEASNSSCRAGNTAAVSSKAALMYAFIESEKKLLYELLGILKGETIVPEGRLDSLLDDVSYLWAHFPDCAGAGGARPSSGDIGFLKRVRVEIEPFIKTWDMTARGLFERL
ncbi:MAG: DUF115 domain-containing protein [Spirochaetaceae bacterium]|jgi:hypothetical protein|nr:DUF115 domain-containing protein [Spirochaetaceae bacterium]